MYLVQVNTIIQFVANYLQAGILSCVMLSKQNLSYFCCIATYFGGWIIITISLHVHTYMCYFNKCIQTLKIMRHPIAKHFSIDNILNVSLSLPYCILGLYYNSVLDIVCRFE